MKPSLTDCYCHLGFQVTESEDLLWVGFKAGMVHAIVKEVWNERPLTRSDAELFYEKFSTLNKVHRNLYFRILAHGGFLPEALDFELHGLAVSDENYIESLLSGRHVELYPHNEAAYRSITQGFKQHRIGAVVQATGTGKSYLLARYIASPSVTQRIRREHLFSGDGFPVGHTAAHRGDIGRTGALADYV